MAHLCVIMKKHGQHYFHLVPLVLDTWLFHRTHSSGRVSPNLFGLSPHHVHCTQQCAIFACSFVVATPCFCQLCQVRLYIQSGNGTGSLLNLHGWKWHAGPSSSSLISSERSTNACYSDHKLYKCLYTIGFLMCAALLISACILNSGWNKIVVIYCSNFSEVWLKIEGVFKQCNMIF